MGNANAVLLDERSKQHEVHVVGESHRQEAFAAVASARGRSDPGPGEDYGRGEWRHVIAVLLAEPSNPYDPNAIAVQIVAGRGYPAAQVGYLSRADAFAYGPVLAAAAKQGSAIAANAKITGGGEGYSYGLVLRMGTPDECLSEVQPPKKSR